MTFAPFLKVLDVGGERKPKTSWVKKGYSPRLLRKTVSKNSGLTARKIGFVTRVELFT